MTIYITYKCSICRREKDIEQNKIHALPNQCTITKGCAGSLKSIEESTIKHATLPRAGVEDWYPRGTVIVNSNVIPELKSAVSLSTSYSGALVIAVKESIEANLPEYLNVIFAQRRTEDVAFQDYHFKTAAITKIFSGKDQSGKILRFDSQAIAEGRVLIRVNGISQSSGAILTENKLEFYTGVQGQVNIRVKLEKETIEKTVTLLRNSSQGQSDTRGAWSNVNYFTKLSGAVVEKWWLYSINSFTGLGIGKLQILGISTSADTLILLAHEPYASIDRYYHLVLPTDQLKNDFYLSTTGQSLTVDKSLIGEIYPPLILIRPGSFVVPDVLKTGAISQNINSSLDTILPGAKIIGPI